MKTLKNGKEVKYYAVCPECASHLEYCYEDIRKCGGAESGSRYIVCPVCEERIKVNHAAANAPLFNGFVSTLNACGCSTN